MRWLKKIAVLVCFSFIFSAGGAALAADGITASPAFTGADLMEPPRENWITNGGTLYNQRYAPLDRINRDNVADLKALWKTRMGSGGGPRHDGQAQILSYEGVIYVVNGINDVFAMELATGEVLWVYRGNPPANAGVGKSSRGVAMGDGKIFVAQIDAKLVALDQKTGEVIWSVEAEDWKAGFSITSAPLYYDGMVITGFSGGELGIRGRVKAYDADTGDLIWTFYTVPGPGEFGHDTWPDNDAWKNGGAPVWQTPAVDPDLGMVYFATGNPGPDLHGGIRAGDNLFSVSIVALDVHTGEYKWHFQQVRHDLWDYDASNPVILFDAEIDGTMRKGLVQVGKTGWAYILDRETGEPLIGIEEKPVAQEPRQATAATQPFPVGDSIVPQEVDITPEGARLVPDGTHIVNHGRIFTPFWEDMIAVLPGPMGGANWPPSSFDPESKILYVCATDRIGTYRVDPDLEPPEPGKVYMGGMFGQANAEDRGIFAALDVTTNRLVWRQQWREICYSGSVVTKGGLLFVGRSDGRLTALDKRNGEMLWEFQTDAGVNTTVTTVDWQGKQYVVIHAGGSTFAGSPKGDTIWAFTLDGEIGPAPPLGGSARQGLAMRGGPPGEGEPAPGEPARGVTVPDGPPDLTLGEEIFKEACAQCHGPDGRSGHGGGPTLVEATTLETMMLVTTDGRNAMPAFRDIYSQKELYDVSQYILQVLATE